MEDVIAALIASAEAELAAKRKRRPVAPGAPTENPYRATRLVALFHRTLCAHCGTESIDFEGLFEERKHIRVSDIHLVRQPFIPLPSGLPRVKKYLTRDVPYCAACADLPSYQEE